MQDATFTSRVLSFLVATTCLLSSIDARHAELDPSAQATFVSLRSQLREALPHGGNGEGALTVDARSRLEILRRDLETWPGRPQLGNNDWLDLHVMLQAADRRLSPRPPRAGKRGEAVGSARFEWQLRHVHQLHLGLADIELIGDSAYAETLSLLRRQAAMIDPTRTWQELSRRARRARPAAADEVLPMCRRLTLEAWRFAEDSGFVSVPDVALDLGVRLGKNRGDKPYAWYQPGKLEDGFYVGTYMVTPIPADLDPVARDTLLGDVNEHWMRVVSLHEAIPGHHLQFAVASLAKSPVRGWGYTSVFVEGWGLYCEEAMHRHGFYTDPITRLEQLRMRLWRSARVLIDSRLHAGTMSRSEAVDLLVTGVLMAADNAEREVDRYLHSPTQPMSYVVGMTQMDSLRRRAQAGAGDRWDERAFHDQLLAYGPLPIDLVGAVILGERERYDREYP